MRRVCARMPPFQKGVFSVFRDVELRNVSSEEITFAPGLDPAVCGLVQYRISIACKLAQAGGLRRPSRNLQHERPERNRRRCRRSLARQPCRPAARRTLPALHHQPRRRSDTGHHRCTAYRDRAFACSSAGADPRIGAELGLPTAAFTRPAGFFLVLADCNNPFESACRTCGSHGSRCTLNMLLSLPDRL